MLLLSTVYCWWVVLLSLLMMFLLTLVLCILKYLLLLWIVLDLDLLFQAGYLPLLSCMILYITIVYEFLSSDTIGNRPVWSVDIVPISLMINSSLATKWTPTHSWRLWCNFPCPGSSGSIILIVFTLSTTSNLVLWMPCLRRCRSPAADSSLVSGRNFDTNANVNPGKLVKNPFLIACSHVFFTG